MEIICNNCSAVIPKPDLRTIRDGEIEETEQALKQLESQVSTTYRAC